MNYQAKISSPTIQLPSSSGQSLSLRTIPTKVSPSVARGGGIDGVGIPFLFRGSGGRWWWWWCDCRGEQWDARLPKSFLSRMRTHTKVRQFGHQFWCLYSIFSIISLDNPIESQDAWSGFSHATYITMKEFDLIKTDYPTAMTLVIKTWI